MRDCAAGANPIAVSYPFISNARSRITSIKGDRRRIPLGLLMIIPDTPERLSHTVRGTFAGTFKKKLGLALVSDKGEGDRVYRIAG